MSTVSSTSSSSALSSLSTKTGIGGLVSGLDTDSIVEGMTLSSRTKISKEEAKVTKMEWKQEGYRTVTKALKEFQSKYLDVLSDTNFRSEKLYNTVAASTASTKISVKASSSATTGSITINKITQLATSQTVTGDKTVSAGLNGILTSSGATSLLNSITSDGSKSFKMTLDGTTKTITLDSAFVTKANADGFKSALQEKVTAAFGNKADGTTPLIDVSFADNQLGFSADGSKITVNTLNNATATLDYLGLTNGQSNKLNTSSTLEDLTLAKTLSGDTYSLSINSVDFTFSKTDSLATVMSRINASDAGVTMSYSNITDKFTLTANDSGTGQNIVVKETAGNLMSAFNLTGTDSKNTDGKNAILTVNDKEITRSSNSFDVEGIKVDLLDTTAADEKITISCKQDTTSLKETITNFVKDYNALIDTMNGLVKEKYDSDYQPLTDEQKKDMSETEIKNWETKAKTGLLAGDSTLKSITSKMQTLMYSSAVKGGITLYNMGITSAGYTENGKLTIDEDKLETALETKGDAIKELFTTETKGLANQLNSIVEGAAKTSGVQGKRGSLVELAGYESTMSETENSLSESIKKLNDNIDDMKDSLKDEETRYWNKFTALETAIQQLNSQASVFTSSSSS